MDSVRRAQVALIEDWGPVTNTTSIQHHLNTVPPHNSVSASHTYDEGAARREGCVQCSSGARLAPPGNSSSPCSHYSACATPHSITVRAWRALEHYIAPSLQRVTLRYPGMRQGRRYWRGGGWAFLGASLRPPYDVPAILAGIGHTHRCHPPSQMT